MQVLPSTLKAAVIRVLKTVARDTQLIDYYELKDQWQTTGLRDSDYQAAIDEMVRCGMAKVISRNPLLFVELTDLGVRESQRSRAPILVRTRDWLTLERAQWRQIWRSMPSRRLRRRRSVDHVSAIMSPSSKNDGRL